MVVLGDVSVGKSSLIQRFVKNTFNDVYKATIGVDFEVEKFCIIGKSFNLQIWDTAGQERFRCIAAGWFILLIFWFISLYVILSRRKISHFKPIIVAHKPSY